MAEEKNTTEPTNTNTPPAAGVVSDSILHPTVTLPDSVIPLLPARNSQFTSSGSGGARRDTAPIKIEHIPGYEIAGPIGRGAMGVVYKARQIKLQRTVALKVLVGKSHGNPEDIARFHSEAVTVAQIQHPNVMQIYDVGEHAGIVYLAAEYVDGGTLEGKMNGQRMPLADAIKLMYLVARGVGAAHSKGVVHRDLKPSNILLTADGVPKVADFGLAKQLGPDPASISASVMGTPAYMAPEQAAGHNHRVGPQTDVYALGVILYQCLSGDVPLKGDSLLGMLETIRDVEPPNIRVARPDVPNELEAIITRCLKKIPSDRYATADVLADELQKLAAQWGAIVRRTNAPIPDPKVEAKPEWEFPWKIPAIVGGAAFMILIGLYLAGSFTKTAATKRDKGKPTEPSGQTTSTIPNLTP